MTANPAAAATAPVTMNPAESPATAGPATPATAPATGLRRPRIGVLGIMQALYDDMIPGITERQAGYAQEVADRLAGIADFTVGPPVVSPS